MFRRLAVNQAVVAAAARFYTPPADLQKLYASDFDKQKFPVNIVPSDSVLFAQFLFKAAEPKGNFDVIVKDLAAIAAAVPKLPVFWERTCNVHEVKEFKSLSAPVIFTLAWMQNNGMLELLPDVAQVYEAYANAQLKRVAAKVYVAPGEEGNAKNIEAARKVADEVIKGNPALKGFTLTTKVIVDRSIVSGFAVDVQGTFINHAEGRVIQTHVADESDYTTIALPKLAKTTWDDNIQTEVLRKYLDSLAEYDAEELARGV